MLEGNTPSSNTGPLEWALSARCRQGKGVTTGGSAQINCRFMYWRAGILEVGVRRARSTLRQCHRPGAQHYRTSSHVWVCPVRLSIHSLSAWCALSFLEQHTHLSFAVLIRLIEIEPVTMTSCSKTVNIPQYLRKSTNPMRIRPTPPVHVGPLEPGFGELALDRSVGQVRDRPAGMKCRT